MKIRPWRVLAAVLGGLVAFGLVVHAIVGAIWPRGTAGLIPTGVFEFTTHGWLAVALRHWLVLPKHTYEVANYEIGNYAFVTLIALVLGLTARPVAGGGTCCSCRRSGRRRSSGRPA